MWAITWHTVSMARGIGSDSDVRRTTLELDVEELRRAKETLGTRTARETVNKALREVNRMAALRAAAALIRQGGLNIVEPEDIEELRRSRLEAEP